MEGLTTKQVNMMWGKNANKNTVFIISYLVHQSDFIKLGF